MARRLGAAVLLAGGLLLTADGAAAVLSPDRQAQLVDFLRHDCGSCHGLTMKGGLGPALLPSSLTGKPSDALSEIILDGQPDTPMPPWRGLLSVEEARWIVEQLKKGLPE